MKQLTGNVYDCLDDHPTGGLGTREDPPWENI